MALITLTTDFGYQDHYIAALKARLLGTHVIDISHDISPFNISHASYVLKNVFRDFPEGSIHLVSVNESTAVFDPCIGIKLEGHVFLGVDNGFFSLISALEPEEAVFLEGNEQSSNHVFYAKSILAPAALRLSGGASLQELGVPAEQLKKRLNMQVKTAKNLISGNIVHIDRYGNLITDIEKKVFDTICDGRDFVIKLGRETTNVIHSSYNTREFGDYLALFNSNGFLEIALSNGHASDLLGVKRNYRVMIQFSPQRE
ncbi:SAM-dependent chlorinase/fluorinase [Cytophagaceae bacterium ABcell3]|nr:SAM-dependent chlorinase/fluorinase [Cytophagaceae bacterium ABcell3]